MKVKRSVKPIVFSDRDSDDRLEVRYDNKGDPFSEGVSLQFTSWDDRCISVMLDDSEVQKLIAKLQEFVAH